MTNNDDIERIGPLGALSNPIRCDGPAGERTYLDQLIAKPFQHIRYKRLGSISSDVGRLDQYQITNLQGFELARLHFDMYHQDYVELAIPPGFVRINPEQIDRAVVENMFGEQGERDSQTMLRTLTEQYGPVQIDESNHGYIYAKIHRLLLCGPRYYASEDFFSHPLSRWDWAGIVDASKQMVQQYAGLYREHPIVVDRADTLIQLLQTVHFDVQNVTEPTVAEPLLIDAQHSVTKQKIQFWFCVRSQ